MEKLGKYLFGLSASLIGIAIVFVFKLDTVSPNGMVVLMSIALLSGLVGVFILAKIDSKDYWKDVAYGSSVFFTNLLLGLIPALIARVFLFPNEIMTINMLVILIGFVAVVVLAFMSYTYEQRTKREKVKKD